MSWFQDPGVPELLCRPCDPRCGYDREVRLTDEAVEKYRRRREAERMRVLARRRLRLAFKVTP